MVLEVSKLLFTHRITYHIVNMLIMHRKHVFQDLRPYVCTFKDCAEASKLFTSRHEWFSHEAGVHRLEWFCHVCSQTSPSAADFRNHLTNSIKMLFRNTRSTSLQREVFGQENLNRNVQFAAKNIVLGNYEAI